MGESMPNDYAALADVFGADAGGRVSRRAAAGIIAGSSLAGFTVAGLIGWALSAALS